MRCRSEVFGVALLAAAVGGCSEPDVQVCSSGLVCPGTKVCDLQGETCVDPTGLLVAQGEIQLGTVGCGTTSEETITLSNLGDQPVDFSASSTFDFLVLEPAAGTVLPGSSFDVVATVNTAEVSVPVGEVPGAITFQTDDQLITRPARVEITGASVSLSTSTLDFGVSNLATPRAPRSLIISNDGNAAVELQLGSLATPFASSDTGPFTIAGGASQEVEVSYDPTLVGDYQDQLSLSFSGPLCQTPDLQVSLKGIVSDASLLVDTATLDFGASGCGAAAASQDVVITNKAVDGQTIKFEIAGAKEAFEIPGGIALAPDQSGVVSITRKAVGRPTTPGDKPATMTITSEPAGESVAINLVHQVNGAFLVASPALIDLGTLAQGVGVLMDFDVSNDGNASGVVTFTPEEHALGNDGTIRPNATEFSLGAGKINENTMTAFSGTSAQPDRRYDFDIDSPNNCNETFALEVFASVSD